MPQTGTAARCAVAVEGVAVELAVVVVVLFGGSRRTTTLVSSDAATVVHRYGSPGHTIRIATQLEPITMAAIPTISANVFHCSTPQELIRYHFTLRASGCAVPVTWLTG